VTTALRNEPPLGPKDSDPRYGSGVPAHVRASGMGFIEMSGIPRPAWLRADAAPRTSDSTAAPPSVDTGAAANLFQDLIDELSGVAPPRPAEATPTEIALPADDDIGQRAESPEPAPALLRSPRSAVALQALAEAEQLLQALDRLDPATSASLPEATVAMLQQALAAAPDDVVEITPHVEAPPSIAERNAALEASLPPLEDFAQPVHPPVEAKATPSEPPTISRPHAPLVSAPGYTVLGDGPITWPGQPMPKHQSRPAWAVVLVLFAAIAAATAWWGQSLNSNTPTAVIEQSLGLWPQRSLWAARSAPLDTAPPVAPKETARTLGLGGIAAVHEGRFGDANELLARARAATPTDNVLRLVVVRAHARAQAKLGEGSAARESIRAALALPENMTRDRDFRALAELAREEASSAATPEARRVLLDEAVAALRAALALPELGTEDRRELRKMIAWMEAELSPASTDGGPQ